MLEYALDMVDWSTAIPPTGIMDRIKRFSIRRWVRGVNRSLSACYLMEDMGGVLWWICSY